MVRATVHIDRPLALPAPLDRAWALLSDVPRWGRLFPHVVSVEPFDDPGHPVGDARPAFVWRMEPLGPPGGRVETVYACRYHTDPDRHTLAWAPIPDVGTAQFDGACALWADGARTAGTLRLDATLEIPAPSFVRGIVQPAVALEMSRMTDVFVGRLREALAV